MKDKHLGVVWVYKAKVGQTFQQRHAGDSQNNILSRFRF